MLSEAKTAIDKKLEQAKQILMSIVDDNTVPRNIRRAAKEAHDNLTVENEPAAVRANQSISVLDEISQDPNCPMYARTRIWQAVSILETIRDEA